MAIVLSIDDDDGKKKKAAGDNIDNGNNTGNLISSERVIQKFSRTSAASLFAFCALQIIEALIAPID